MIKYLGSKRRLLPAILAAVAQVDGARTVTDLFSGTSRVGHALKAGGYRVLANDHNAYAATLAQCYVVADRETHAEPAARLLAELARVPAREGWFTQTFCRDSRYLHPRNGARIEGMREWLEARELPAVLRAVLLTALLEAADRVDSTTGVQMAYLKSWAPRADKELSLRLPALLPRSPHGSGEAHRLDALEAASQLRGDVAYIDPPYNQHSYLGNYHVWESLVLWDQPEVYGVACKRSDCRERRSAFNSRRQARAAFETLVARAAVPVLIVSCSDEGFLRREDIAQILAPHGAVTVQDSVHDRYVGARIGIHDPQGRKVGRVGRLTNVESLIVCRRGAATEAAVPAAVAAAAAASGAPPA